MIRSRDFAGLVVIAIACLFAGCAASAERSITTFATLPTREVQASLPADFEEVYDAALRIVRDELGYVSVEQRDEQTGRGRIDGSLDGGGSVRVETERSRDRTSTSVRVLAVETGATEANADRAREIVQRIERSLWPEKP